MATYLITGNPGSGKTSIAAELVALGHVAVDADDIAGWSDASGAPVEQPTRPSDAWLLQHRWVWSRDRLDALVAAHERLFVCGIAMNQRDLADAFDVVFLLAIDEQTQLERLDAPSNAGRNAAQRQQIIDGRPVFEAEMVADGAIVLDGRLPSAELARLVLARISD